MHSIKNLCVCVCDCARVGMCVFINMDKKTERLIDAYTYIKIEIWMDR